MPADDLVLNVRQIAGYPDAGFASANDAILIQRGGLGGPYLTLTAGELVGTALQSGGGDMTVSGTLTASALNGGSLAFSNGVINVLSATTLMATFGSIGGAPIATETYANNLFACTVHSFNGKRGDVWLDAADLVTAGGAPIFSPVFEGEPQAPTPALTSNDGSIATTAFVQQAVGGYLNYWVGQQTDFAPIASPAFTGNPTAPTAAAGDASQSLATTAFVTDALAGIDLSAYAPLNSPSFSGYVSAPTPPPGTNDGQVATTAFVHAAVVASTTGVSSFNTRTGAVTLQTTDITAAGGAALASPVFTGTPQAPTPAPGSNSNLIATTAFVTAALATASGVASFNGRTGAVSLTTSDITGAGGAPSSNPTFTGVAAAATAAPGTNTTQLATTAFVTAALTTAGGVASFNGRTGAVNLGANDLSAVGGALISSPAFTGAPTAPTASVGTNTTQLATTAFVAAAISALAGVASFNGRTGAVTLGTGDITGAGGAILASPAFTGTPSAPTATAGTATTQLATTAFVQAAISSVSGVTTFNSRSGAVTLTWADVSATGAAPLGSPAFTGSPTAPTPAAGSNNTQLATTAYVAAALVGAGVTSFNGRGGAVILTSADLSAAGGALLSSPAFTGTPTAPTAATVDSSTTIATTAFVKAALPVASSSVPLMNGTAAVGTGTTWARSDHVHPTDTSRAAASALANYLPLAGGTLTGNVNGTTIALTGNLSAPGAVFSTNVQTAQAQINGALTLAAGTTTVIANTNSSFLQFNGGTDPSQGANFILSSGGRAGYAVQFYWANVLLGEFDYSGNLAISGNLAQGSDRAWKREIEDASDGLDAVLKLAPKRYRRTDGDGRKELGFVAQDVREALPIAVTEMGEGLGVTLMPLIAALVNAIKQLTTRLEKLEAIT